MNYFSLCCVFLQLLEFTRKLADEMEQKFTLQQWVEDHFTEAVATYRYLHRHPELSFNEERTADFIEQKLAEWGIPFQKNIGGRGILGSIKGAKPGKTIALRADMDALPIIENSGVEFSSENAGVMHACGHDAHMTCLLGVAKILNMQKANLEGEVKLIFQPGEERYPGGANLMLQDGLFAEEKPEVVIGQHVLPGMATGTLGIRSGLCMASADEIYFTVKGNGGHGALPHTLNDTVLAASSIIVGLQQVISRRIPAHIPSVLSFGKFIAPGATNVIPEEIEIAGTFRIMDEEWRKKAQQMIAETATHIAAANGCAVEVDIKHGYPCVYNDPAVTAKTKAYLQQHFGNDAVQDMEIRMTAEDFGFFSQEFPSVFYRFGITGACNKDAGGLHTPHFKIDEEALKTGIEGMLCLALNFLENK